MTYVSDEAGDGADVWSSCVGVDIALYLQATHSFAILRRVLRIIAIGDIDYWSMPDTNLLKLFLQRASSFSA